MANVTLNVTDNQGKATGTVDAPAEIFGFSAEEVQSRIPLIHQVRAPSVHRSGTTAAPCSVRSRVTTPSAPRRR